MNERSDYEWLLRERRRLLGQLAAWPPVLRGSLREHMSRCGNPNCRCRAEKNPVLHGPYRYLSHRYQNRTQPIYEQMRWSHRQRLPGVLQPYPRPPQTTLSGPPAASDQKVGIVFRGRPEAAEILHAVQGVGQTDRYAQRAVGGTQARKLHCSAGRSDRPTTPCAANQVESSTCRQIHHETLRQAVLACHLFGSSGGLLSQQHRRANAPR